MPWPSPALPWRGSRRAVAGVTLIELVITIAIVGLLAAVAVPSYQQYLRKGERQKAADCLMQVHNRAQSYFQSRGFRAGTGGTLEALSLTTLGYGASPYRCPESRYEVVRDASYDRLTDAQCGSLFKYQFRARARSGETAQARDGEMVLGFCDNSDPNRRLVREREVSGVKKSWTEN